MSMRISGAAIGELHTLFRWGAMGTWTDGQFMTQFLDRPEGSEAAFRVLIHRHGPMVLGVCRRTWETSTRRRMRSRRRSWSW